MSKIEPLDDGKNLEIERAMQDLEKDIETVKERLQNSKAKETHCLSSVLFDEDEQE